MAGIDQTPVSIVDPTLERAQRLERAVLHVAKAIELELADIALNGVTLDLESPEVQSMRELGATLLRVSSYGLNTANNLAVALGEAPTTLQAPESAKHVASQLRLEEPTKPAVVEQPETTGQPESADSSETPVAAEPVAAPVIPTPSESRLSRKQEISEQPARTRKTLERQKPQYEGELYAKIVSEKETPLMELREGMTPIPVRIIGNDTLVINDEKIVLEGDQLFAFNAMMKLRDNMITAKMIRELGFRIEGPSASPTLSRAITELTKQFEQVMGPGQQTIIKKIGQAAGTKYAINPAVVLEDERLEGSDDDSASEIVKKN